MRKYNKNTNELEAAVCNCCGKSMKIQNGMLLEGICSVDTTWGYFSGKDLEKQSLICARSATIGLHCRLRFHRKFRRTRRFRISGSSASFWKKGEGAMQRGFTIQSKVDGLMLDGLVVEPEEGVQRTALLQLSHGMSEYKERYLPFMEFMAEHGVVCVIHDHRGHGKSVKSEQDLGFMYGAGGAGLVEDLFQVTVWAKKEYPDLPFILMGHSMGSLVVRTYAKEHDRELDALIVCGSPSKNYLRPLGAAVGHAEAAVLGDEHRSNLLEAMSFGSFAARFADEKSRFAWCCSDPEVVREYEENPLCGFTFSDDAFFALNDLLKETYGFHGWHCTNRKLPVLFLSGGDDPCYVNVRRFKKSIDHMRLIGYRNVRGKLYPGMRHEILNEKEKYRVYGDVWKWLKKEKVVGNVEGGSTPPQTPDGALAGSGGV